MGELFLITSQNAPRLSAAALLQAKKRGAEIRIEEGAQALLAKPARTVLETTPHAFMPGAFAVVRQLPARKPRVVLAQEKASRLGKKSATGAPKWVLYGGRERRATRRR